MRQTCGDGFPLGDFEDYYCTLMRQPEAKAALPKAPAIKAI